MTIHSENDIITLNDHIYFLEDKNQNLTIKDILKAESQEKFQLNHQNPFIRPSSKSVYWFKVTIVNHMQKDAWIEVGNSLLWHVDFFRNTGNDYSLITSTGSLRDESNKSYPNHLFMLPLGSENQPQTVYIRTFTERRVNVDIKAGSILSLTKRSLEYRTILISFITTFAFLLFLNSYFLYISKNRSYLFYIFYILTGFPGLLYLYNFPIQSFILPQELGFFIIKNPSFWINLPFAFVSLLAIQLLNIRENSIAKKILLFFAFFFLFLSPMFDEISMNLTTNRFPVSQLLAIVNLFFLVGIGINHWRSTRSQSTAFFVTGWFFLLAGLTIYQFTSIGFLEYSLINRSALLFGSILESIFFSISIVRQSDLFQIKKVADLTNRLDLAAEVFDSLSEYIAVTDLKGNILRVNQAWKDFKIENDTSLSLIGSPVGLNYLELFRNINLDSESERIQSAQAGIIAVVSGEVTQFNFEYPYTSLGELKWYLMNVSRLQGSIPGLVVTHINISKRKKSEIEKTMAKDILNGALEAIAEGILITDGENKILQYNKKFRMMFQFSYQSVITSDENLLNQEILSKVGNPEEAKARIDEIYQNKSLKSFDIIEFTNGELYERYSHPLLHDTEIVGRVWSYRDVTARVEVTNDLFAWKRFITTVTDAIPGLVSYWTTDLKCTFANYRYEEWFGKKQSSIVGHHIRELQGESSFHENWPYLQRVLNGDEVRFESQIVGDLNQTINLWTHFIPDKHGLSGEVVGFIILVSDISELKTIQLQLERAKEKAEAATQAKSDFLATMSHEIRTPLNGVIGFTDLLLQTELSQEQDRYLQIVSNSSMALLSLLNDILDFSKIEAGKLEIDFVLGDIKAIAKQAVDVISFQAREKKLTVIENYFESIPTRLYFDPVRVRQILINLLSNAVKFTSGGEIEVSIQMLNEEFTIGSKQIRFIIRDTGIGISEEKQKIIFDPFSQGDSSTTREYGGTGLGLAITNKLLGLMGSSLEVESEVGKGSKFYFTLNLSALNPIVVKAKNPMISATEIGDKKRSKNQLENLEILLVDDDEVNLFLLKSILESTLPSPNILLASNGNVAIEVFNQHNPDFIFMDVQMPIMNGLEATVEIRKLLRGKKLPIIALTAAAFQSEIEKCYLSGMSDYAIKPIKKDVIIQILEKWILNETR